MRTTRYLLVLCTVFLFAVGLVSRTPAAPVPPLASERDAVWEAAWETAWEIAWESPSDLTVEFSGDVQSGEGLEFTLEFHDPAIKALDISWGAPETGSSQETAGLVASFGLPWAEERAFHEELRLGKLYVETTPADASVRLLNADKQFRQGMELSAGQYVLEVAKDGFEPQVRRVEIIEGMAATVHMDLMLVADAGAQMAPGGAYPGGSQAYAPPQPEAATADQLAKQLATPEEGPDVQSVSQTAPPAQEASSRPADLGLLQLAEADISVSPSRKLPLPKTAAGTLRVTTTPAEAQVRILDIKPKFKQGIALEPGVYTIDAQLYGYGAVTREVTIEPGRETAVDLTLQKLPEGRLYVKTVPENAYVRILDIKPRFQQGMELAEGTYTIDATVSGYETVEKKVQVTGGQDTVVEVQLEQVAPTGRLYVDILPADADIRVLGILPKFYQGIELAAGSYTIDAQVDGGERVEMQVQIAADQENRYTMALNDAAEPGRLYVQTVPAGAQVRIMDIKAPFQQGMVLEPGSYTIDIAEQGFESRTQMISVLPGRETRVAVALQLADAAQAPAETPAPSQAWGEPLLPVAEEVAARMQPERTAGQTPKQEPVETGIAAGDISVEPLVTVEQELDIKPAVYQHSETILLEANESSVKSLDVEIFLSMASLAYNAGDYLGAIDSTSQVLALDEHNIQAQVLRSKAYMGLGQYQDALRILDGALNRNPGNEQLLRIRKEIYQDRELRTEQEAANSTAISLDPRYYEVKGN